VEFRFILEPHNYSVTRFSIPLGQIHIFTVGIAFFFVSLMVAENDMGARAILVIPVILSFFASLALYAYENTKALEKFRLPEKPAQPSSVSAAQKGE